jgi:hypothetical protein
VKLLRFALHCLAASPVRATLGAASLPLAYHSATIAGRLSLGGFQLRLYASSSLRVPQHL